MAARPLSRGAHIYLFAAGTGGYGTSPTSLISSTAPNAFEDGNGNYYVVTDGSGNFALGGDYTCTEGTQVYMVAYGGNPGMTGTVNNTAIVQMAGLGQCPAAGNLAAQVPYLVINEVTTVAFAYAMGGFGSMRVEHLEQCGELAGFGDGDCERDGECQQHRESVARDGAGRNERQREQRQSADEDQCAGQYSCDLREHVERELVACTNLFNAAKSSAGVPATDEANAIFNIVHNPANTSTNTTHVNAIWNLTPTTPVFSPTLSAMPTRLDDAGHLQRACQPAGDQRTQPDHQRTVQHGVRCQRKCVDRRSSEGCGRGWTAGRSTHLQQRFRHDQGSCGIAG